MFKWIKKITTNPRRDSLSEEMYQQFQQQKQDGLERVLGPMNDLMIHSLIPYPVGGTVDMYFFCEKIPGTIIATMELVEPDGTGSKPNRYGTFELIACTKHLVEAKPYEVFDYEKLDTPFSQIQGQIRHLLTSVGRYSEIAALNPGETCEIPNENEPNNFLIFDRFDNPDNPFTIGDNKHNLLLVMEIFPSECSYARENGSSALFALLKEKGYYPYSDLEREPVI